jgi:hypothetical protein
MEPYLELTAGNSGTPNSILLNDEPYFNLHCAINKKNFRYWAAENPHEFHECPLHIRKKLPLRTAITGPYFF